LEKPEKLDCDDNDKNKWKLLKPLYKDQDKDGFGFGNAQELCAGDEAPVGFSLNKNDYFPKDESRNGYDWGLSLRSNGSVINSVTTDAYGFIYITGYFFGNLLIDNHIKRSKGYNDIFLIKLDKERNIVWGRTFGSKYTDDAKMILFKEGYIYLLGSFNDSMEIDDQVITANDKDDWFIAVFNFEGDLKWMKNIGYKGVINRPRVLNVTSYNNVVVSGIKDYRESDSIKTQYYRGFVKKLSKEGDIWDRTVFYNNNYQSVHSVIDGKDNIYIVGSFEDSILFKKEKKFLSNGDKDAYVLKIDKDGNDVWLKTFGGKGEEYPLKILIDQDDRLVVTGFFHNEVDFDPTEKTDIRQSKGEKDTFISFFTTDGDYLKTYTFGGKKSDQMENLILDNDGNIYANGYSASHKEFPDNTSRYVVLKMSPEGQIIWYKRYEEFRYNSLVFASPTKDKIILAGSFQGPLDFDFTDNIDEHTSPLRIWEGFMFSF